MTIIRIHILPLSKRRCGPKNSNFAKNLKGKESRTIRAAQQRTFLLKKKPIASPPRNAKDAPRSFILSTIARNTAPLAVPPNTITPITKAAAPNTISTTTPTAPLSIHESRAATRYPKTNRTSKTKTCPNHQIRHHPLRKTQPREGLQGVYEKER